MKHFYLIRHAQSESNAGLAIKPNAQIEITALGVQQAQCLADWLDCTLAHCTIQQIFCSPYLRTQQTAQPFLQKTGQSFQIIDTLHEFNYLEFDRIQHFDFSKIINESNIYWQRQDPAFIDGKTAESYHQFVQRVHSTIHTFKQLPDGHYIVFTHGMWIGMLIWQLMRLDHQYIDQMMAFRQFELAMRADNTDVFQLTFHQTQPFITKLRCCPSHLSSA